jgi:hypothetical protein
VAPGNRQSRPKEKWAVSDKTLANNDSMMPPPGLPGGDIFSLMSELSRTMGPETSVEFGRKVIGDLRKWRKMDEKAAPLISMAIDLLTNGSDESKNMDGDRNSDETT